MGTLVIMIPTYNEKENLPIMLAELDKVANNLNSYKTIILVVDDQSPDNTALIAQKTKLKNAQVVVNQGTKLGLGKALIRGYKFAIKDLDAKIVVSIDCDFLFDPHDIPKLVSEIENGYDVVLGSRHDHNGTRVSGWPISRYITHWIANDFFGGFIAGNNIVRDHNANFRAVKSDLLKQVKWESLPTKGYGFLNYMIFIYEKLGAKFKEVKVDMKWRTKGESKVSFNPKYFKTFMRDTKEYIFMCIKIRLCRFGIIKL